MRFFATHVCREQVSGGRHGAALTLDMAGRLRFYLTRLVVARAVKRGSEFEDLPVDFGNRAEHSLSSSSAASRKTGLN